MKILIGFAFLVFFSASSWSGLICQVTKITPGMTINQVKSLCGDPFDESKKLETLVCNNEVGSTNSICQKIESQTLTYKRPSTYIVELQNDKVFRVK